MIHAADVVGLLLLITSLICLGTWPALLRLCSLQDEPTITPRSTTTRNCCTALYNAGRLRNICHVYLDYSTAYVVVSTMPLLLITLMVSTTNNNNATHHVPQQSVALVLVAMMGGCLLSIGNLSFQWSTAVYGAPLTTVLAIQASSTVVLGTSLNYLLEPSKTVRPAMLLTGVLVFLVAIFLATRAQMQYCTTAQQQQQQPLQPVPLGEPYSEMEVEMEMRYGSTTSSSSSSSSLSHPEKPRHQQVPHHNVFRDNEDELLHVEASESVVLGDGARNNAVEAAEPSDGIPSHHHHHHHVHFIWINKPFTGVAIAMIGGLCFGFFSPAFNIAVNDPFAWAAAGNSNDQQDEESLSSDTLDASTSSSSWTHEQLVVARANFWFSLAFFLASCVGNAVLLSLSSHESNNSNNSVSSLSSWLHLCQTYLWQDSFRDRRIAFAAGTVCAAGNLLQFQGGQLVGYAAADLVQAFPIVSTLWDIFLFGEFQHDMDTHLVCLLLGMYATYLTGIGLLAGSSVAS